MQENGINSNLVNEKNCCADHLSGLHKPICRNALGAISGATLLAFLTRLLRPVYWPMYAGMLSSMRLGFLIQKAWLMPLTIITLLFMISSFTYRANTRRRFAPFILGIFGAMALLSRQFIFPSLATGTGLFEWVIISK